MSAFYWVIDHRAPRYVPRSEPHLVQMPLALITAALAVPTVVLAVVAAVTHGLIAAAFALAFGALLYRWCRLLRAYVIRIPDDAGLDHYRVSEHLVRMQKLYARHAELRPVMEPVLLTSYALARETREGPVRERLGAVRELVADAEMATTDPAVDNADLDELLSIVKIRREMRGEGLL